MKQRVKLTERQTDIKTERQTYKERQLGVIKEEDKLTEKKQTDRQTDK